MSTPSKEALVAAQYFSQYIGTDDPLYAHSVVLGGAKAIDAEFVALHKEVDQLREWKKSMLALEATWDEQAVGRLLGLQLGTNVRNLIAPSIRRLKEQISSLEAKLNEYDS